MEAKVDVRKLQLLSDRISQTIDALTQVRYSVHGIGHSNAFLPHLAPFYGVHGAGVLGHTNPHFGFGIGHTNPHFGYGQTNPHFGFGIGHTNPHFGYGIGHTNPAFGFGLPHFAGAYGQPSWVGGYMGVPSWLGGVGIGHTNPGFTTPFGYGVHPLHHVGNPVAAFGAGMPWMGFGSLSHSNPELDPQWWQRASATFPFAFGGVVPSTF
jgi:hypothetical protein